VRATWHPGDASQRQNQQENRQSSNSSRTHGLLRFVHEISL
jgi:hypothetical protein